VSSQGLDDVEEEEGLFVQDLGFGGQCHVVVVELEPLVSNSGVGDVVALLIC
jgi:hypothetical protein